VHFWYAILEKLYMVVKKPAIMLNNRLFSFPYWLKSIMLKENTK